MVEMNTEHLFAQITRLRFWVIVGVVVLIFYLHPEWVFGMLKEDLTALDIVLGIVEGGIVLVGFSVLLFGSPSKDPLTLMIGLAMAGGGALLLWLTFV